jgi:hypothetical protein
VPGQYQFRYLKTISAGLQVWFDVSDGNTSIPAQEGLFLKVSRLPSTASGNGRPHPNAFVESPSQVVPPTKPPRQSDKARAANEPPTRTEGLLNFDSIDEINSSPPKGYQYDIILP